MNKTIISCITVLLVMGINLELLSQNNIIEVTTKRNDNKTVDLSYTKTLPGSYYVTLEFTVMENCYQRTYTRVVKNNSGHLITLRPVNKDQHINFSYKLRYIKGHPNPKVDKDFVYFLPFKEGKSIRIIESSSLKETYFNAEKDENWKSFIVNRADADTIYNMRKGIVTEVVSKHKTDTTYAYKYTSNMNKITIEHEDGTSARYIGFKNNDIFVKLGQTVYPQTQLGALDIFNNSIYRLYFDVSYLKDVDLRSTRKRTLSSENKTQHVTPYFYSSKEPIHLKNNNDYKVEIDKDILLEEFTRREKKQYRKNPKSFE